jgi:hypothetical protein
VDWGVTVPPYDTAVNPVIRKAVVKMANNFFFIGISSFFKSMKIRYD